MSDHAPSLPPSASPSQSLEAALAARDRQLSIATHELRTPISSILLNLQMLERASKAHGMMEGAAVTRYLEVPMRQLRRLMHMVDLLLDTAQVESERLVLDRRPMDLCELVHDVTGRLQAMAHDAGCDLQVQACTSVTGDWDHLRLEQVLHNLLTNGIKYGGGRVEISTWREGDEARLAVKDGGFGIAPEDQEAVFQPFKRLRSAATEDGAGLGLYIVREIILAHGGRITLDSRAGDGAAFHISLPIRNKSHGPSQGQQ
jgi:signal transduction histidine kinase